MASRSRTIETTITHHRAAIVVLRSRSCGRRAAHCLLVVCLCVAPHAAAGFAQRTKEATTACRHVAMSGNDSGKGHPFRGVSAVGGEHGAIVTQNKYRKKKPEHGTKHRQTSVSLLDGWGEYAETRITKRNSKKRVTRLLVALRRRRLRSQAEAHIFFVVLFWCWVFLCCDGILFVDLNYSPAPARGAGESTRGVPSGE